VVHHFSAAQKQLAILILNDPQVRTASEILKPKSGSCLPPRLVSFRVADNQFGTTRATLGQAFYARNDHVGSVMTSNYLNNACALALVSGTEARQRL
jgi:hypothetical protein